MSNSIRLYIYIITLVIIAILMNIIKNPFLAVLCLLLYFIILWFLLSWKTFNAKWICDECNKNINISFLENMRSFFSFKNKIYYRKLYCNRCKQKKWFRCILEDKLK